MTPFLRWLDRFLERIARPFSKADTIEIYGKNGYWIFGTCLMALVFVLLLAFGLLRGITGGVPKASRPLLANLFARIHLDFLSPSLPFAVILLALLVVGGLRAKLKIPIGKFLAYVAFRLMEAGVAAGEYCIEHRGKSAALITAMIIAVTWGIVHEKEKERRAVLIRQNFDSWLQVSERFVERNPLSRPQPNEYAKVSSFWQPEFHAILSLPDGQRHPAYYLHELMEKLYRVEPQGTYKEYLRSVEPELAKLSEECKIDLRPKDERLLDESRSKDLINIQMGRIYNKLSEKALSEGDFSKQCGQCEAEQKKAFDYFSDVDVELYQDQEMRRVYLSAAHNGKGTILMNKFVSKFIWKQQVNTDGICRTGDALQCAADALEEYKKAAEKFEECSFHQMRKLNNITDLINKIAPVFDQVFNKNRPLQNEDWMFSKDQMSKTLISNVRAMMVCNTKDVFIPITFLTAAQAYGAIATLDPDSRAERLDSAAHYLKIANSYESGNIKDWALFCLCSTRTTDGGLDSLFSKPLSKKDGLELSDINISTLTDALTQQCRPLTSK